MKLSKLNISLVVAVLTMPLFIYAIINVLPTYDDWSTLSSPNFIQHVFVLNAETYRAATDLFDSSPP